MHMVTYSLLPLRLTTKEFSVIRVCLNCKTINKQVIVFSWAKRRRVWFVGKLLPMWKGRTERRTKSAENEFFFALGSTSPAWPHVLCPPIPPESTTGLLQTLSNRSCLDLLVVSVLEELIAWYSGFFFF